MTRVDLSHVHTDSYFLEIHEAPREYNGGAFFGPFALSSAAHTFAERLKRQCPGTWGWGITGMISALAANSELRIQEHVQNPPKAICGFGGCTFMPGHESEHSWGGAA